MLLVVTQDESEKYLMEYFYLREDEEHHWHMKGLARLDVEHTEAVDLGVYNFYRQAIDVFAQMDYYANDLLRFKSGNKIFYMPANIIDERELEAQYPIRRY